MNTGQIGALAGLMDLAQVVVAARRGTPDYLAAHSNSSQLDNVVDLRNDSPERRLRISYWLLV